jgi:anti-sigma-K factor RskA
MKQDNDPLFQALASLRPIAPDIEWETRVRARCRAAISRRASRQARVGRSLSFAGIVDLAAAAALSFYLASVFVEAARLRGLLS